MLRRKDIKGEPHVLVVMKVTERDELGRPSAVQLGYDDSRFSVVDGDEFITAWIRETAAKGHVLGSA